MRNQHTSAASQQLTPSTHSNAIKLRIIALACAGLIAGCSGDDGSDGAPGADGAPGSDGNDGEDGRPALSAGTFLRANNGSDNAGTVDVTNEYGELLYTLETTNNQGLVYGHQDQLIQAGDADTGSIKTLCATSLRAQNNGFSSTWDRAISGPNSTLVNPKGMTLASAHGILLVADFGAMQISAFGAMASGDNVPVAVTATDAAPWDLAYDDINDRLYAALTNGTVAVYDNYIASGMTATPARTIVPSDSNGDAIGVNLHGIAFDGSQNRLVLSDVGSAQSPDDGALFVIEGAAMADGNTPVSRMIAGPSTRLGNPVDILLEGATLRVAEKSNDAILVYTNIFNGASGDIAPDFVTMTSKPESLARKQHTTHFDASDIDRPATVRGVAVSSNPGTAGPTTGMIAQLNAPLSAMNMTFDTQATIESVTFDIEGNGYATFDSSDGSSGGIIIANRIANTRDDGMFTLSQDRMVSGTNTTLTSPKGIDIASKQGLVFVAEFSTSNRGIKVFSRCASGNVAPLMTLLPANDARPWDVDYDAQSDRAFVALTNGTIAVFDEVSAKMYGGMSTLAGEDRLIVPAMSGMAVAAPTNIHGIDYDPLSDALIVTDVGSAADATDGKIYVLNSAAMASGLTNIDIAISGPNSMLGNPVDIMFSGRDLYLAEKSNGLVMRWDNILNRVSGDVSADASYAFVAPESIALVLQK
ncbi:hypothetical protein FIU82_15750 (plasmid) [Pseudoalteromonas sp. THAF3]|uniref:hypothetical protein n=1 Tax=Pseudoalteromonas sp. THAF3 TaxID=2587843 RepID=UPI0012A8395B|nr:hypothetical protein [Pseudoalteromonas sp. THAF3]QFU06444.1 hypothetical protein FIU82_15750 [Pseudoalteromonas sp. THAF3]